MANNSISLSQLKLEKILMMDWLRQITLNKLHNKFGAFKLLIFSVSILFLVALASYKIGNFYQGHQSKLIAEQSERLDRLYLQNEQAQSRINTLNVELEIEKLASYKAQQALRSLEDDHFSLKKELAFYEKIMAPEKEANGVVIDEVQVVETASPGHYRLRVVLVQQQKSKRYAKGRVEVSFNGSLNDRPASINLLNIAKINKQELNFSFQYFQVFEVEFELTENFIPEKIQVAAILPKGRWQKYHRLDETYAWPEFAVKTAAQ